MPIPFHRSATRLVLGLVPLCVAGTAGAWGATEGSVVCRSPSVVLAMDTTSSQADGFSVEDAVAAIDGKRLSGSITKLATSKAQRHGLKADDTRLFPNLLTFDADGSKTRIGIVIRDRTLGSVDPKLPVELYVSREGAREVKEIGHCSWIDEASTVARDWIESAHCAERCAAANPGAPVAECVKSNCKPTPLDAPP
jgi:hypothetical protein